MKTKIFFLSPLPPPNYGSALSSQEILEFLKKTKKFEIKSVKLNYSKEISDIGKITINKIVGIKTVKNQIKQTLREFRPDIIYFMPATDSFGLIREYLFFKEIRHNTDQKMLVHLKTRISEKNWKNPIYAKIYKNILKDKNSYYIILGKELIKDLKGFVPKNKIFILPNAIKNEISNQKLAKIIKQRAKTKPTNILFLSNMDRTKGWPKLLQTCKILNKKGINFKCYFAGAWIRKKDKIFFFNFIKKNNLNEKIFYEGRVDKTQKSELLKKTHILVFPTEYPLETFGRVIIEAMMFSIPVVANSIATIPSIVQDKKTGFLLQKNTPEEIAEKIKILVKNPKLAEKMGKEGRKKFLERFEISKYAKKFKKILNKI